MDSECVDNEYVDYETLQRNYESLKNDYKSLKNDYDRLQNEYSENIIIQSMNEMKERYTRLLQTTVPNFKYKLLCEKYVMLVKQSSACCVFIDYAVKLLKHIEMIRPNDKNQMLKIEMQLLSIKDLLEDELNDCINPK